MGLMALTDSIADSHNRALVGSYLYYLQVEKGLSPLSVESYITDISQYLDYIQKPIEKAQTQEIINFFVELQTHGLSFKSIARKRSSLKSFYGFLTEEEIETDADFVLVPSVKAPRHLPDALSNDEIFTLLDGLALKTPLDWRNKAMLEMMYATGIRISETISLTMHSIEWKRRMLKVTGKGRKQRFVPIAEQSVDFVRTYIETYRDRLRKGKMTDVLFLNRSGKGLTRMGVWKMLRKKAEEAGITKAVSPHTIRHTFATHLLENGANLRTIQVLLGHASINTTQIYTNIDLAHLKEEHALYHPRG
ncbi:MAG: tyrosine recombinase [Candidatus Cloacimonetes bacterium]|nr:tyrosine recombinase [Candidatus Cloacimonadota bacterium]